jgi:hypothetical protein
MSVTTNHAHSLLAAPVRRRGLMDTIDRSFMNLAYGWAFSMPVRKVFYNITITGPSVVVAMVIGTIDLTGLLMSELDLSGSSGAGSRTSTSTGLGSSSWGAMRDLSFSGEQEVLGGVCQAPSDCLSSGARVG